MKWPQWVIDWIERDSETWAPVPSIRIAYVSGPTFRREKSGATDGSDYCATSLANRLVKDTSASDIGLDPSYGPTHLQKQSLFGFLITSPFCFHIWWQIRPQRTEMDGPRLRNVPGSELCPYFRIGKGRWDALDQKFIKPTLYLGLHWD